MSLIGSDADILLWGTVFALVGNLGAALGSYLGILMWGILKPPL